MTELNAFEPPKKFDATWRDDLVKALIAGDDATALQKLGQLGVEAFITSC